MTSKERDRKRTLLAGYRGREASLKEQMKVDPNPFTARQLRTVSRHRLWLAHQLAAQPRAEVSV